MGASLHSFTHPTNNVDHSHGITQKKCFKAFILPCFSVCFRGNHIRLYQIEAVLAMADHLKWLKRAPSSSRGDVKAIMQPGLAQRHPVISTACRVKLALT
jgi:hypothetical protein